MKEMLRGYGFRIDWFVQESCDQKSDIIFRN